MGCEHTCAGERGERQVPCRARRHLSLLLDAPFLGRKRTFGRNLRGAHRWKLLVHFKLNARRVRVKYESRVPRILRPSGVSMLSASPFVWCDTQFYKPALCDVTMGSDTYFRSMTSRSRCTCPCEGGLNMLFSGAANINISHTVLMAKCFCFYMQRFNFLSFFFFFLHVKNVWCLFTFTLVQTFFFKDDSITQATGRVSENFSDYNPFSAMEMVSSAAGHVTRVCHRRCHWAAAPFSLPPRRARTQTRPSPCPLRPPSRPSCRRLWSRVRKWVAHTCRDQDLETILRESQFLLHSAWELIRVHLGGFKLFFRDILITRSAHIIQSGLGAWESLVEKSVF